MSISSVWALNDIEGSKNLVESRTFGGETVDLGATYGFLTNDDIANRFTVLTILQLLFTTIGWFSLRNIWMLFRPDEVSSEIDTTALINFILSDQNAVSNVALGIGYGIAGSLMWLALAQLGTPLTSRSDAKANEKEDAINYNDFNADTVLDKTDPDFNLVTLFDNVLGLTSVLRSVLIQTVLSASFLSFWMVMRLLPERNELNVRRKRTPYLSLQDETIQTIPRNPYIAWIQEEQIKY